MFVGLLAHFVRREMIAFLMGSRGGGVGVGGEVVELNNADMGAGRHCVSPGCLDVWSMADGLILWVRIDEGKGPDRR
jgi:hypothetical protein